MLVAPQRKAIEVVAKWWWTIMYVCCGNLAMARAPCDSDYAEWLSKPEALIRADQPREFPGLHVLCFWLETEQENKVRVEAFSGGVDFRELNVNPKSFTLADIVVKNWKALRATLKKELGFTKASNNWGYLNLKQSFGLFNSAGQRLSDPKQVLSSRLVFLFEGGQWIWPPVRSGFVRKLDEGLELETLSVQPILYRVRGFLKLSECEQLIGLGRPLMFDSPVTLMDKDKGKEAKEFRTSTQARLNHRQYPVLQDIDLRVSKLTHVPKSYNEEIQILRYERTQYYSAHLDNWDPRYYSSSDTAFMEHGHRNRLATVFWYLTNVSKGGQTLFPRAHGLPQPFDLYSCDNGLKVTPEAGTVILWYSLHPNGNNDQNGLHAACPVEGDEEKWSANYWVWNKPRSDSERLPDEGVDDPEDGESAEDPPARKEGPTALFKNVLDQTVKLFWKSGNTEAFMMQIPPGTSASLNTFKGHEFIARATDDAQKEFLGPYKMESESLQEFSIHAEERPTKAEI